MPQASQDEHATVRHDPTRQRYELATPDGPAIAAYEQDAGAIVMTHTVVPASQEGKGVATRLIAGALADVRARGLTIIPRCPFVAAYVDSHPDVRDLVAARA